MYLVPHSSSQPQYSHVPVLDFLHFPGASIRDPIKNGQLTRVGGPDREASKM